MGSARGAATPSARSVSPPDPAGLEVAAGDARACRQLALRHARTFSLASWLLPERKRRGAFAIYATCRTADDIVDASGLRQEAGARALRRFREAAFRALERRAEQPILRELARTCHEFDVPLDALAELFDALERDLHDVEYRTWSDLQAYCEGVAGSVGEMCCPIFGLATDLGGRKSTAVTFARTLGVAMQLTNIPRDVGEDAARGRCYLPTMDLERYGLERRQVLSAAVRSDWDAWRAFMASQVARSRDLYAKAMPGIRLLETDAQRCAMACATGYSKILDAIEHADFDTLSGRVSASRATLLGVAWRSWLGGPPQLDDPLPAPSQKADRAST